MRLQKILGLKPFPIGLRFAVGGEDAARWQRAALRPAPTVEILLRGSIKQPPRMAIGGAGGRG